MTHLQLRPAAGGFIIAASLLAGCAQVPPARGTGADMPMQMQGGMATQMPPGMDAQMKRMQQMHERMAAAKTPAERQALMAEHQKVMQDGMGMMSGMQGTQPVPGSAEAQRMMEMRMRMMESMMQMMMDRMDAMQPSR